MKNSNKIYYLLFLLFSVHIAFAENGTITGKIYDESAGTTLPKATIVLKGTKLGTYSDIKGEFKIKNVPFGTYTLEARYIGYQTKEITNVVVNGNIDDIQIVLSPQVSQGKEIVVEEKRVNDNEAAILAQRKNANQVSDGISIQEIKRTDDGDAGQSLKRVAGITLVNDKFVYIRGTSERYSNTTLNGASLASTEPDKKAFAFDMFPSDFLQSAQVIKSFTPDLPANFAGGLVELNTIDFPQKKNISFNLSSGLNSQTTFQDNKFISFPGSNASWLGFDKNYFSYPTNTPNSPEAMRNLLFNDLKSTDPTIQKEAEKQWFQMGKSFKDDVWDPKKYTANPNMGLSLSYADILSVAENDLGLVATVNYGNSRTFLPIYRSVLYSDGNDLYYYSDGVQSTYSTNLGSLVNISYKIGKASSISFKNTFNNTSDWEVIQIKGKKEVNYIMQMSMEYLQKTIFSSQLTGEHLLDFQNSQINWRLGYSFSNREQPDLRRVRYSTNDTTQPYRLDLYSLPQGNSSQAGRFYSSLNENAYSGGLDYKIPFGNLNLKIGTLIEDKHRDFKVRSFTIVETKSIIRSYYDESAGYYVKNYTDPQVTDLYYINDLNEMNPAIIFNPNNFYLHGLGLSEDTKNTDSYKANESIYAGYFMVDFPVDLFSRKLKVIAGARYEVSQQLLNNYYPFYNQETKTYYDSNFVNKQFNDILPSLNLVYELNNKMNLRASATQTLARPSLREYAPFTFYDFLFQSNVKGNPNLKRALIQNYDLRYEWFTNPGEIFSVSAFYKIFDNAIEETILPTSSEYDRTFTNAQGKAYNYGIELEARKNLGFLADFLSYLSVNANLSLIKSEITVQQVAKKDTRPMWGQSPYSINLGLFYFNPELGTSFNLAYNTYGKRIIQVADVAAYSFANPHIYEMPRNMVDVSLSQKLFEFVNIKLSVKNLLNDELVWEQNGKQVATNLYGTNYNLSFDIKF